VWITTEYGGEDFYEAVKQYRYDWDNDKLIFKKTPLHDWTSHFADMLRYAAQAEKEMVEDATETKFIQPAYKPQMEYEGGTVAQSFINNNDFLPTNEYQGR
jgi:hypothetical protein